MLETLDKLENDVKDFHDNVLASNDLINKLTQIIESIKETNKSITEKIQVLEEIVNSLPDDFKKTNEEFLLKLSSDLHSKQQKYFESLDKTNILLIENAETINEKYRTFVATLETINIDKLYNMSESLQSSINRKTNQLIIGFGIVILLLVLVLLIK